MSSRIVFLDRDGVLNAVCVDPEHGTVDSPLHPSQVEVYPWVPEALKRLGDLGYTLAITTNQPSAAKGKTTRANLDAVHARVVEVATSKGARIATSQICFHRSEDGCECRKPKPGMLEAAFRELGGVDRTQTWMVGDGVTDVDAGLRFGARTGFFGPRKCDACKIFEDRRLTPTYWGRNLADFVDFLTASETASDRT